MEVILDAAVTNQKYKNMYLAAKKQLDLCLFNFLGIKMFTYFIFLPSFSLRKSSNNSSTSQQRKATAAFIKSIKSDCGGCSK